MDRADVATLSLKLTGVYALIEAIKLVPTIAIPLRDAIETRGVDWRDVAIVGVPLLLACGLLSALGWLLITHGRRLGDRLLGEPRQETIDFLGEMPHLQGVAFSVVGLVMLTDGIPKLVGFSAAALTERSHLWVHLRAQAPDLLVLFIELSTGYWLFFMPRTAVRIWRRWASWPMDPPSTLPPRPASDHKGGAQERDRA